VPAALVMIQNHLPENLLEYKIKLENGENIFESIFKNVNPQTPPDSLQTKEALQCYYNLLLKQ